MNEVAETPVTEESDLLTPEELAMLKKLTAKRKAQQAGMSKHKDNLFESLTTAFGPTIAKVKKDVVTISTGDPLEDGNVYAITFGSDEETEQEVDTKELATTIIGNHLAAIEPIMGISSSMKVTGTYEGKKLYWQIRKRS